MTSNPYLTSIQAVAEALLIGESGRVTWHGSQLDELGDLPDELADTALISHVSGLLYQAYYVYGQPQDDIPAGDQQTSLLSSSAHFLNRLLEANTGTAQWTLTSTTEWTEPESLLVDVWGIKFRVPDSATRLVGSAGTLNVKMPGVLTMNSPGFVMFIGDWGPRRSERQRTIRLYWNVTAPGAIALAAELTQTLNAARIPFQFKVRYSDQPWTDRADPAVLYLSLGDLVDCFHELSAIARQLKSVLRPYIPALTYRFAHGVGLAEDPGGHAASYGTEICELIAKGLVAAHRQGSITTTDRVGRVEQAFRNAGRSLSAPYVNAGSEDIVLPAATLVGKAEGVRSDARPGDGDWLAAVERVADGIEKQALWSGNRCTWLEPPIDPAAERILRPATPDVFQGLAGIGLLFAELYRTTASASYRDTALGAMRQAADTYSGLPTAGLYAGVPGVGYAMALVGAAVDDDAMCSAGKRLALDSAASSLDPVRQESFDMVYGIAGSILALLGLHRMGDEGELETAIRLGDQLIATALESAGGLYWCSPGLPHSNGLVGLAHGASGAVLALAELGSVSGEARFWNTAERARAYERQWYDEKRQNWPDIRDDVTRPRSRDRYGWCYGAPGVALARLRLASTAGGTDTADEAVVAIARTRHAASEFPRFGHDTCLCHGAAGLAEILSLSPPGLAEPADFTLTRDLVQVALDHCQGSGPWPHGNGLMLGASGIAFAALRQAEPEVLSPLSLLHRELPGQRG